MKRPRQNPVTHRQDHLGDPRDSSSGLGVTDVRLHRPQPQRLTLLTAIAVHRQQRLRLDRITQSSPRAVGLDRIHLGRGEPGARQRLTDHPLLRRTVGGRQPVGGAILVDRTAPDHSQDLMPEPPRIRQALQHEHSGAFAPAHAIRGIRERLAPAVGGDTAEPGELDEHAWVSDHRDAAGEGH